MVKMSSLLAAERKPKVFAINKNVRTRQALKIKHVFTSFLNKKSNDSVKGQSVHALLQRRREKMRMHSSLSNFEIV